VDRHLLDARHFRRSQTPVASDHRELAALDGPDGERLHHVGLAEAAGEPREGVGVHVGAGVEALDHLDLVDLEQRSR
jgi:hypothetical protein